MRMARWIDMFRKALWLAFEHDMLNTAKAAAYSGMLMLFPTMVVVTTLLAFVPEGTTMMGQFRMSFMNFVPADTYVLLSHPCRRGDFNRHSSSLPLQSSAFLPASA